MPGSLAVLRDDHRAEAEALLTRAVEEEVRRSGGRLDGDTLLSRARSVLEDLAGSAAEEYTAYVRALDEAAAEQPSLSRRLSRKELGTPVVATAVAAVAAFGTDLAYGTDAGAALGVGAAAMVAGAAATVLKLTAATGRRRTGRPGGSVGPAARSSCGSSG